MFCYESTATQRLHYVAGVVILCVQAISNTTTCNVGPADVALILSAGDSVNSSQWEQVGRQSCEITVFHPTVL